MPHQHLLDFNRGNVFATADNDVFASVTDLQVPIRVDHSYIARPQPATPKRKVGCLLVAIVAAHDDVPAYHDFTHRLTIVWHFAILLIDHKHLAGHQPFD